MSPDRIRSPCFASQLGFSSICAILWVTSGFTDLKKHCGCWCSRTKRECHWKSLKAALHLCAYLLSLLNLFFKIESEIPSIFSYLELKQCNQNIIYTIFVFYHLASEKITWDWVLFFKQCNLEACTATHYKQKGKKFFRLPAWTPPCFISLLPSHTWAARAGLLLLDQTTCATHLTPSKPRLA